MTATSRDVRTAREIWPDDPLPTRRASTPWHRKYRFALFVTDLLLIVVALLTVEYLRFGAGTGAVAVGEEVIGYGVVGLGIELVWILALTANESRSRRVVGAGLEEYRKVLNATLAAFGTVAIISYLLQIQLSRFYFVVALPLGLALLFAGRLAWRLYLTSVRRSGRALTGTLVVGDQDEVDLALDELRTHPEAGYRPVAVSVSRPFGQDRQPGPQPIEDGTLWQGRHPAPGTELPQVPRSQLKEVIRDPRLGAVIVAGSMARQEVRELAWDLEDSHVELILVSRLTDVAGPRIHNSPVDALPMVHVDLPQYTGFNHVAKRAMDVVVSLGALVLLSPLVGLIALAIKVEDGGPVVFRQQRVGQNGSTFTMHKFRSMALDAEERLAELRRLDEGNGVLFKIRQDPRVTRVGRILRRYSMDELPQFWDVLLGSMSVVGPRPPLASEVETYEQHVRRRLLTKPGITGLWQVSGRSDLSWEESVRLDLRYVENWSVTGDVVIILKTARAVLRARGAY